MPDNSANNNQTPAQVIMRFWHHRPAYQKWGAVAAVALALIVLVFGYKGTAEMTAGARLIRDIIVFCLAAIGIGMAFWRNASLDGQSKAANEQAKVANKQAKTAAKRLLNDQFANAVELMAKETTGEKPKPAIASRIGGIYIMADLAIKRPVEFAEQVVINLIAYIKHNAQLTATPELKEGETPAKPRTLGGDVKAAFSVLSSILGNPAIIINESILDFSQENFSGLDFWRIDLSHYKKWTETKFIRCDLTEVRFADGAEMPSIKCSDAILRKTEMKGATLCSADFRGAVLVSADMRGADLTGADMQGCRMHFAKLQQADDGKSTNMAWAKLAGADLLDAYMNGAKVTRADFRGVMLYNTDLTDTPTLLSAEFGSTYMATDKIDKWAKSELFGDAQSGGWLNLNGQDADRPDKIDWRLKQYEDGYALAGFLMNFADAPSFEDTGFPGEIWSPSNHMPRERKSIRQQAAELDLDELPPNTPEEIKVWLKEIKAKYPKQAE